MEKLWIIINITKLITNLGAYFYFIKFHNKENKYLANQIIKEVKNGGNIFWKLTQWICSRVEFQYNMENNYLINELKSFYDKCPAHDFQITKEIIENHYKKNINDIFKSIDSIPLASGSIGQVHQGILKNGRKVAIKVRHPNIKENIQYLCDSINYIKEKAFQYSIVRNNLLNFDLDGLDLYLLEQTDFKKEFNNLKKLRNIYKNIKYIHIPEPIICNEELLIMEYVDGCNIEQYHKESIKNKDNKHWEAMVKFWLFIRESILLRNFCHADLHKGNWKVWKDKIVIYDLGIILDNPIHFNDYKKIWEGLECREPKVYVPILLKNSINKSKTNEKEFLQFMQTKMDLNAQDFSGDIKLILEYLNKQGITMKFHLLSYLMAFNLALGNFKNFNFINDNKTYIEGHLDRLTILKDKCKKYNNIPLHKRVCTDEQTFLNHNKERLRQIIAKKNEKLKEIDDVLDNLTDEETE